MFHSGTLKYCRTKDLACLARHFSNITDVYNCQRCELSCAHAVFEIEKLSKTYSTVAFSSLNCQNVLEIVLYAYFFRYLADPSYVNIEFLTWPIIRYKREVLFGWVDLLVSFGGIAGLFLGFSLLSGVEIIYYFTLRTCCMFYRNRVSTHQS